MKKNYLYIYALLILIGLIAGSLFANIYCINVNEQGAFLNEFINIIENVEFNSKELLSYILKERIKMLLLFTLLSFTNIVVFAKVALVFITGLFWGYMCSSMVMVYGIGGILIFLFLCLLAQGIFVVALFAGMNAGTVFKNTRSNVVKIIYWVIVSLMIVFVAVFIELYVNLNLAKYYYLM